MEGDITPDEIERLRLYTQALIFRKNHFTSTLATIEGVKLEVVKDWELVKDCLPAGHGGNIMELEDAANAEELSKVREEKAELRVSAGFMYCACCLLMYVMRCVHTDP